MVWTGHHPHDSPISGRLPWHARQWVEPRPCRRPGPHARADRRPGQGLSSPPPTSPRESGAASRAGACDSPVSPEAHPGPDPLVLVVVLGVPCRLAYVRAADPKYVSLPQFGSYRLGHLPPHPHVRSAARRHHQARRHRRLGDPEGGSWAGPARDTASHSSVGPAIFSRPAWLGGPKGASIPASPASEGSALLTIASRVSSGSSRRRSRSRCAGTTPPARLVSAHAGGWPRERDRELAARDGESPSAPRR